MNELSARVVLIGGAPGAGKTTLGAALSRRLGFTSLSVDDLMIGAQAVTTAEAHPGLHVMRRVPSLEYFTNSSLNELEADATAQHEATWPIVERVVRKHATHGPGIVIDGWHLRPSRVAELDLPGVQSVWLVTTPAVLEARERENLDWFQQSTDPDRMMANFVARSLWYNDFIQEEATRFGMNVLVQPGTASVDHPCAMVIARALAGR